MSPTNSDGPAIGAVDLVAAARAIVPRLKERATAAETERRIPQDTVDEFRRAGFFRMLQPKQYGGLEVDPKTYFDVLITCAEGCGSSAWVLGILSVHAWQLAHFPDAALKELWGKSPDALVSSSYAPTGKVERVDGGYRVSGRWQFSSGCDHADWVILGGAVMTGGLMPDLRALLLPRSDYRIDDTWHVAGLCGTGSKDIVVDGAFVPEHRALSTGALVMFQTDRIKHHDDVLYRYPFATIFFYSISVPSLGLARAALDLYKARVATKMSAFDGSRFADDPTVHMRIAQATADIDAAHALLHHNMDMLAAVAEHSTNYTLETRSRVRWEGIHILSTAVRVVDSLFAESGGHAIFLSDPMQRVFRDIQAMRVHAINNPEKAGIGYGRLALGIDAGAQVMMI